VKLSAVGHVDVKGNTNVSEKERDRMFLRNVGYTYEHTRFHNAEQHQENALYFWRKKEDHFVRRFPGFVRSSF
jgi:hypothetical protein